MGSTADLYRENHVDKNDERLGLFRAVVEHFGASNALYPGCYVHVTPSFVVPTVVYVDSDRRAAKFFAEPAALRLITERREYESEPIVRFHRQDYAEPIDEPANSFDLLISQYAGFVSRACKRYLAIGGHLAVNNSHGDASMAALDPDYELAAVYQRRGERVTLSRDELDSYMVPKSGKASSPAELERAMRGPTFTRRAAGYVFRKVR